MNKIIVFLVCIFCSLLAFGQKAQRYDTVIKNASFIFEGEVVSTSEFYGMDSLYNKDSAGYTSNLIRITCVLRGHNKLQIGTIEIVTLGINKTAIMSGDEIAGYIENNSNQQYAVGYKGMFFCVEVGDFPTLNPTTNNSTRLKPYSFWNPKAFFWYRDVKYSDKIPEKYIYRVMGMLRTFSSVQKLYDFLDDFQNLKIPKVIKE